MKTIRLEAPLIVVGGGLSGVCASLQAARLGINTILVHNRPVLGGNSSSEIRVWTRGATGAGSLFGEEMGILGKLKLRNLYVNPDYNPIFWDEVLLDSVLGEKQITLLLNTHIERIVCENGKISSLFGVQQASEHAYELVGQYYIDATGDGMIGEQAGVPYEVGDFLYQKGEENKKRELLSSSILYYVKDVGHSVPFIAPDYAYGINYIQSLVNKGGRIISEKQTGSDCWWFEYGGLCNTISDAQEIGIELRRLVFGIWNYIKNSGKYPEADHYTLEWVGSMPGKRESRRMVAEYMLSKEDILEQRQFIDAAFYGGWYMDFHPAAGLNSQEANCEQIPVNMYEIPLRCLYNRKVENLLFAGRIIGTKREAFASTRVMNTCALSGQAAAVLACGCLKWRKAPAVLSGQQIKWVQDILQREDMFIPGKRYQGADDLARNAELTVSSEYTIIPEPEERFLTFSKGGFLIVPCADASIVYVQMRNENDKKVRLKVSYYITDTPNRLCPGEVVRQEEIYLLHGEQEIALHLPEGKDKYSFIMFDADKNIGIRRNKKRNPGILCGKQNSSDYGDPCIRLQAQSLYTVEALKNGYIRPYGGANIWCSAPEQRPWILLEWKQEISFQEIRLFLDPEFSMEIPSSCAERWDESHKFTLRSMMPPQLARDIIVERYYDGAWQLLVEKCNNWDRLLVLDFDKPIVAQKLRVTFERNWGDPRAHLYQISIYKNTIKMEKEDFEV